LPVLCSTPRPRRRSRQGLSGGYCWRPRWGQFRLRRHGRALRACRVPTRAAHRRPQRRSTAVGDARDVAL